MSASQGIARVYHQRLENTMSMLQRSTLVEKKDCSENAIVEFKAIAMMGMPITDHERAIHEYQRITYSMDKEAYKGQVSRFPHLAFHTDGYTLARTLGVNSLVHIRWEWHNGMWNCIVEPMSGEEKVDDGPPMKIVRPKKSSIRKYETRPARRGGSGSESERGSGRGFARGRRGDRRGNAFGSKPRVSPGDYNRLLSELNAEETSADTEQEVEAVSSEVVDLTPNQKINWADESENDDELARKLLTGASSD